jgi:signal peptidase II
MLPYFLILLVFLVDRLSKGWATSYLAEHGPTQFNSFFSIQETYNKGIAFGMFQGAGPAVGWLTVVIVIGLFIYLVRLPKGDKLMRIGLALIIGGALGNMVDRVTVGEVLDFIATPFRSSIFNVADIAINVGMVIVILATVGAMLNAKKRNLAGFRPE